MKHVSMCYDKNCQSTKSAKSVCDDKNCQPTQCIHMWPVKSVMKSSYMQSVRPTMLQSKYRTLIYEECKVRPVSLYDDKNCRPTKSLCDGKNCQSAKCVHMWKPAMPQSTYKKLTQSTHLQSISKTARK